MMSPTEKPPEKVEPPSSEEVVSATTSNPFWIKEHAEGIVAFVGIAYACGFFTVMVHTYSLGAPVLELGQPIYVWVGLPLAIAFVASKSFIRFLMEAHR